MSTTDRGGERGAGLAAYPFQFVDPKTNTMHIFTGPTLREWYAGLIMAQLQGSILNSTNDVIEQTRAGRAEHAVAEADALLAALSGGRT